MGITLCSLCGFAPLREIVSYLHAFSAFPQSVSPSGPRPEKTRTARSAVATNSSNDRPPCLENSRPDQIGTEFSSLPKTATLHFTLNQDNAKSYLDSLAKLAAKPAGKATPSGEEK